jgi:hypothetical protein
MTTSPLDEIQAAMAAGGADGALACLADRLRAAGRYGEMFDVRLMQARRKLGLPIVMSATLDELQDPLRGKLEAAYLEACREVGDLLLKAGRIREAWLYLRPVGDKVAVARALEQAAPEDGRIDELVEVAVHEGVAPRRGFELVLENYGICNAITMFDSTMGFRPRSDQQAVAALLIEHLYRDLLRNVKAEIARQEGRPPAEPSLADLVRDRDWLFLDNAYHIDTSHLHAVVRFGRVVDDPAVLRLAIDLTEYGRRLSSQFQFQSDEPFAEGYVAHGHFFRALAGEHVEEGVAYFREKAASLPVEEHGLGPAEVYVALLSRLGRHQEAFDAAVRYIPPEARPSGFAPNLFELARLAGCYDKLLEVSRQRNDWLVFTAGLVEQAAAQA